MRQSQGTRKPPPAARQRPRDHRVPERRYEPEPVRYEPQRPGIGRRIWRLLTHTVTVMVVALAVLFGVIYSLDLGKDSVPANPDDLSANQMLALVQNTDVDPRTAYVVAAAKQRAYEQQVKDAAAAKQRAAQDAKNKARTAKDRARAKASAQASALARSNPSAAQNRAYGKQMNALKGWDRCWPQLKTLWEHESNWNERAENPSSGAYGIPQALPPTKLASAGADWKTSSPTQIAWGLGYIKARYKDPCGAWSWWQSHHWY